MMTASDRRRIEQLWAQPDLGEREALEALAAHGCGATLPRPKLYDLDTGEPRWTAAEIKQLVGR